MINAKALLVAAMAVTATLPAGAANDWVAQPRRAEQVDWPIHAFAGRDFWTLLSPKWLDLPGVKDERFVQDSGLIDVYLPLIGRENISRTMAVMEIEVFQASSRSNVAPGSAVTYASDASEVIVFHPERINDGNRELGVSISASQKPVKERYRPFRVTLQISLPAVAPLSAITIYHGAAGQAQMESVDFYAIVKGKERLKLEPATLTRTAAEIRATFTNTPAVGRLQLDCLSVKPIISVGALSPDLARRCRTYPFWPQGSFHFGTGRILGLNADNFDAASWDQFLHDYQNTFMGYDLGEWDGNFFQMLERKESLTYADLMQYISGEYTTRQEAETMLRTIWDYQKQTLPGPVWGLSGERNYPQYGAAWGGTIVGMELTGNSPDYPHRSHMMFTRGAARQYDKPWLIYVAYYRNSAAANSKSKGDAVHPLGLDYGIAPSQGRRLFYLSYYQGATFLTFESQPWGQVKQEDGNGPCSLTENGKAIKDIYEWVHGEKSQRGTCYTPILFLMDYLHGHDEWQRGKEWKTWEAIPFTDGDYMAEHFLRTIDPFYTTPYDTLPFSPNLHNSKLGDIFDVFFANPPEGNVKPSLLSKYPVVIPLNDIAISAELAERLKDYVTEGGTLLLNSAQCRGALTNEAFLGLNLLPDSIAADGMSIRQVTLTRARALLVSGNSLPLLTKHRLGKGHVLLTTPTFLLLKNKQEANPLIEKILLRLQAEVLPVTVEGDIQFLFNKLADGTWRIVLINNKGILKKTCESTESRDPTYAAAVRITAPAEAQFTELVAQERLTETSAKDKKIVALTVQPGEVRILGVKNLNAAKTDSALIGDWSFDEGQGKTVVDSSGNGYNGAVIGAQYVTNRSGHCLAFNGKDSFVKIEIPAKYALKQGAFEVWACPTLDEPGTGLSRRDVMDSERVMIVLDSNCWCAKIYDGVNYLMLRGPAAMNHQWTHLVITWSSGNVARFYVNGQEVEGVIPLRYLNPPGLHCSTGKIQILDLHIGTQNPAYHKPFHGLIDAARIYDRELTAADIQERYQAGLKQR